MWIDDIKRRHAGRSRHVHRDFTASSLSDIFVSLPIDLEQNTVSVYERRDNITLWVICTYLHLVWKIYTKRSILVNESQDHVCSPQTSLLKVFVSLYRSRFAASVGVTGDLKSASEDVATLARKARRSPHSPQAKYCCCCWSSVVDSKIWYSRIYWRKSDSFFCPFRCCLICYERPMAAAPLLCRQVSLGPPSSVPHSHTGLGVAGSPSSC